MDALGAAMFGRALRLRVLLWVGARESAFYQSQAASEVDYRGVSAVAKELDTLEDLRMVRKFGRPNNTGRQNYIRVESPLWAIVESAREALDQQSSAPEDAAEGS